VGLSTERVYTIGGGKARPRRLAVLIARDLDERGYDAVTLRGVGAGCLTAHAVCLLLAPVEVFDPTGTSRPWHRILKQTDRGDITASTAADVPFELHLRRWPQHPCWPPEWTPQPGGTMVSPEKDEIGIRYVCG